jgi:hypothetical protein
VLIDGILCLLQRLAAELHVAYLETSAMTAEHVDEAFHLLAQML